MDRAPREPDPFLEWKLRLFFAGAILLMAAIFLNLDVLAVLSAVVLGAGAVLIGISRLKQRRVDRATEEAWWADKEEDR